MNQSTDNQEINRISLAIWQTQMVEAAKKPWLAGAILKHSSRILRRFIYFYRRLHAQPRRIRRFLQAKTAATLVGTSLLLALSNTPAYAATITVNGTTCTLLNAIVAANTDTSAGGCIAGNGADTIELQPSSIHSLTQAYSYYGSDGGPIGLPVITSNITINGNGATIEGDVLPTYSSFRIFDVSSTGDLTLNDVTVTGGGGYENGGGIAIFDGNVTINRSSIINGTSGAIYNFDGTITINDSTISGNSASFNGGGIHNRNNGDGAVVTVNNSTISGNSAGFNGGGIYNLDGDIIINNSTISGNTAGENGGGIDVYSRSYPANATVNDSTITGNSANLAGGGLSKRYAFGPYYSGAANLNRTLISGNAATTGRETSIQPGLTLYSNNFNLFGYGGDAGTHGFSPGPTDMVPSTGVQVSDILDTTLQNNGGDIETHALVPGSPAIDAVPATACAAATDQRGVSRPQGSDCDIGAFELEAVVDTDGDGIPDGSDNAPNDYNPDQSDVDGDGIGDVADTCPNDDTDTCDPDGSAATFIDAAAGGSLTTNDGSVAIDIPSGAMAQSSSISITDTDDGSSGFELTTDQGNVLGVFSVDLQPSQTFNSPVKLTFSWSDANSDGLVDGLGVPEGDLIVTKDNAIIADLCQNEPADMTLPDCDMAANTFTFEVTSWSEFALAYPNRPEVTGITAPTDPLSISTQPINVSGTFTDADDDDTHTAVWDWGDGSTSAGIVDQSTNSVTGSHTYAEPGVYTVKLTVTDSFPGSGELIHEFVVIYDPDGGFVTGGGWIYSEPGAYQPDPNLEGKANFGFVSKYKKGKSVPDGNTEFNFKAGDLNFHSDNYDWLVINQGGTNAQYKGSGTINGNAAPTGNLYKFMIWAKDSDPVYGDTFRIKIWYDNGEDVVIYDNGFDQPIGGGNIKIHD